MKPSIRCLLTIVVGVAATINAASAALAGRSVVYAMPDCSCCDAYVKYLEKSGFNVIERVTRHLSTVAKDDGVPAEYRKQPMGMHTGICHITDIGGYSVVGHVPADVIRRLLTQRPHIRGVILPGMPEGSPGMTGKKDGPLVIYAFDSRGKVWPYATE